MPDTGAVYFGGLPCPDCLRRFVARLVFSFLRPDQGRQCSKRTVGQISGRPTAPVRELQTVETKAAGVRTSACLSGAHSYKPMSNVTNEQTRAVHDNQTKVIPPSSRTSQMENRQTGGLSSCATERRDRPWWDGIRQKSEQRARRGPGSPMTL